MAKYNYWVAGGSPTKHDVLPYGLTPGLTGVPITTGEFVLRFKAMAFKNVGTARFLMIDSGAVAIQEYVKPTGVLTQYERPINRASLSGSNNIYIHDPDNSQSIFVTDIELVEKPLGRATINGLDGFLSGKWNINANEKIIDDETIELNATANWQSHYIYVPVDPNTEYTVSKQDSNYIYVQFRDKSGTVITGGPSGISSSLTFKTPSNCTEIRVSQDNSTTIGKFIFKRPMLNLGGPVPYEPKRGERMYLPRKATKTPVGKNLFNVPDLISQAWAAASGANAMYKEYNLKPNTAYTLSSNVPVTSTANMYFNGPNTGVNGVFVGQPKTFTTGADGKLYIAIPNAPYREHTAKLLDGTYWAQLEEGTSATAFEPVKLALRRATKCPKKNLLPPIQFWENNTGGAYEIVNDYKVKIAYALNGKHFKYYTPAEVGKEYSLNVGGEFGIAYFFFTDANKTRIGSSTPNGGKATAPANTKFVETVMNSHTTNSVHTFENWQLEEGTATPFEPYTLINRPAPKGLEFDGIDDKLTFTTPLATLGNKNFEIESTFKYNPANPGNHTQQTIVSCGDIRFGLTSSSAMSVGFYTPATGWINPAVNGTINFLPIDNKIAKLKAVITPDKAKVYFNDDIMVEKAYTGAINAVPQTVMHIASLGPSQYFFSGTLLTLKIISEGVTILDLDFTKPQNNLGTKIKDKNGTEVAVTGNPVQLNRQARR